MGIALGVLAAVLLLLYLSRNIWIATNTTAARNRVLHRLCMDILEVAVHREHAAELFLGLLPQVREANQVFDNLLSKNDYFRNSEHRDWLKTSKNIIGKELLEKAILGLPEGEAALSAMFLSRIVDARPEIDDRNYEFVERKRVEHGELLQSLMNYPLTEEQERAILHDEDRTLVIAGAGTGKTTTLLAKARSLVLSGTATSEDLLVLSFGRDVAGEMREGLRGLGVEVYTFHSFGRSLMAEVGTERLSASKLAEDNKALVQFIEGLIREMLADPAEQELFNFLLNDLSPAKLWLDCRSKKEYWEYIRAHEPRALLEGKKLRSFEEVRIANFLFSQGIRYEYERKYERKTTAPGRQQYKPDFYLLDYGIYIEHFGIDRQGNPGFLQGRDAEDYKDGMSWKRLLHREHGTKLIESYSWEAKEGVLEPNLAEKLNKLGVEFKPRSRSEMLTRFNKSGRVTRLANLFATFLNLYKEGAHELAELFTAPAAQSHRAQAILQIFARILEVYETELRCCNEIDFHDMIHGGKQVLDSGRVSLCCRYVLVDEFQDVSPAKVRFLKAILDNADQPRLFCVGDDWQSIYRFAGADVSVMTHFDDDFGFHKQAVLPETFRFGPNIEELSSKFVLKNPYQIRKRLTCKRPAGKKSVHLLLASKDEKGGEAPLVRAVEMIAEHAMGTPASVFVLGRYNHTHSKAKRALIARLQARFPFLRFAFRTIHKSKGLEADYVIIDDVISDSRGYGLPSEISEDPVIELMLSHSESFPNAEERRLFYVALTRARREAFLISDQTHTSEFIRELVNDKQVNQIDVLEETLLEKCPRCETGVLIKMSGEYGPWRECNLCGYRPRKHIRSRPSSSRTTDEQKAQPPSQSYVAPANARKDTEFEHSVYHQKLARIKEKYPNAYSRWTEHEEQELLQLLKEKVPISTIAEILGRQPSAIRSRRRKLDSIADGTLPAALPDTPQVTKEVVGEVTGEVAGEVRRLLEVLGTNTMTRSQSQTALGLKGQANFGDRYLQPAIEAGLIEMTILDKPRSSKQKYRLTERGRKVIQGSRFKTQD